MNENEDQKQPSEQQQHDIDQLITQANSQAYVFEHSREKRSFKQWFLNLPRTRKLLWVGGAFFIVFVIIIACISLGTSKKQVAKSPDTYTVTTSTTTDVVSTEGDANGDGIIDENDSTSTSTDTTTSTGTSWWQKLLNIKNSSTARTNSDSEASDKAKVASEDGSDDSFMNNYDTIQEEIDSKEVIDLPTDESGSPSSTVTGGSFSIVAMPDTQREVQNDVRNGTSLFSDSMKWIIANKDKRSIKAVVHSGDIVHASSSTGSAASTRMVNGFYETASNGFSMLDNAGILYSIASGNHDTDAICSSNNGGSIWCNAETSSKTAQLLGKTTRFDKTYTTSRKGLQGLTTYRSGHVQSSYRTFSSGSSKWLILTVEYLIPPDVFKWAQQTVASHSDYNVVLVIHRYMSSSASIMSSCEGSCTPAKTVFNNLVMKYPNIKIVVSGHAGYQAIRVDTSPTGNKVVEFQTTMHETTKNPLRLISIDPSKGTIVSRLCLHTNKSSESSCTDKKISNMKFLN